MCLNTEQLIDFHSSDTLHGDAIKWREQKLWRKKILNLPVSEPRHLVKALKGSAVSQGASCEAPQCTATVFCKGHRCWQSFGQYVMQHEDI